MTTAATARNATARRDVSCGAWLAAFLCGVVAAPAFAGTRDDGPKLGLLNLAREGLTKRDCWLYLPKGYDRAKVYPLVVVLHPAGLRGSRFARVWGEAADRTGEFLVLAPECSGLKKRMWKIGDEGELIATIKLVIGRYNIDPTRVLLTGFSQGGVYSYTFGLRSPTVFRAVAPVGGALVARPSPAADQILQRARGVPFYIVHGLLDDRIPVQRARASRDRLEKVGYRVAYREVPHLGHFYPQGESDRIWAWFKALTTVAKPAEKKQ